MVQLSAVNQGSKEKALAILCCWRPICTMLDVETLPLVHTVKHVMMLKTWQNIWCYSAQCTTRFHGSRGPTSNTKAIQDACGAFWRGSGHDASHQLGMRERESRTSLRIHQLILSSTNHVKASSPVQSQKLAFVHCHCGLVLRK